MSVNLGLVAAMIESQTAPNTKFIWRKVDAQGALLGFFAYKDAAWVDFSTPAAAASVAIPVFSSAGDLTAYAGPSKHALFTFIENSITYSFLMQRVTSAKPVNNRSIVNHSVSGDIWLRVGGTPIVFIENLGSTGANSVTSDWFVGYDLNEIKIQTSAGYDLRLSTKSTKTLISANFAFNQNIQGKILIEIS